MINMKMPNALLMGMERKKTFSWGAVRLTRPRPTVARNMTMRIGDERTSVCFMRESPMPRMTDGALEFGMRLLRNNGQMLKLL